MTQAARWIATRTWPVELVPLDVRESLRTVEMFWPTPECPYRRGRFADGSEVWNMDGLFIAKDPRAH